MINFYTKTVLVTIILFINLHSIKSFTVSYQAMLRINEGKVIGAFNELQFIDSEISTIFL